MEISKEFIFKVFLWIIIINKSAAVGSPYFFIKQNYMLTEMSKRMNVVFCLIIIKGLLPPLFLSFKPDKGLRARSSTIICWLRSGQHCKCINQVHPCYKEEVCHTSVLGLDCSCQQTGTPFSWQVQENQPRTFHEPQHTPVIWASSTYQITYRYLSTNLVYITWKLRFVSLHCSVSSLYSLPDQKQAIHRRYFCLTQKQASWVP